MYIKISLLLIKHYEVITYEKEAVYLHALFIDTSTTVGARGGVVEALCYNPEGRGFDFR
jgi:hypothetical protein